MTDKSRDFSTALRYARNDKRANGNASCVREKLANTTHLIFMPEPYPCYPFDPWFIQDFEQIVASLAPKEPPK
jgi:hypothetical protein